MATASTEQKSTEAPESHRIPLERDRTLERLRNHQEELSDLVEARDRLVLLIQSLREDLKILKAKLDEENSHILDVIRQFQAGIQTLDFGDDLESGE